MVGLLVHEGPDKTTLGFSVDWSMSTFDRYLRRIFPELFTYLDLVYGPRAGVEDEFHWQLVQRLNDKAILYARTVIDGRDILKCCYATETIDKGSVGLMIGTSLLPMFM